jgi:hypothetical protein
MKSVSRLSLALVWTIAMAVLMTQSNTATHKELESSRDDVTQLWQKVNDLEQRVSRLESAIGSDKSDRQKTLNLDSLTWKDKSRWRQLHKGMAKSEIRALLGDPAKISTTDTLEIWYYPDALHGSVSFSADGRVTGWDEP